MGDGIGEGGCFQFPAQVVRGRWFMFFASLLIMSGSGVTYLFERFSEVIKENLRYGQEEMNKITSTSTRSAYVGILAGLFCEVTPTWLVLLIGAALNFGSLFMAWTAVMHKIAKPQAWEMAFLVTLGTTSPILSHTIALVTCVKNFPESRGVVLGLMKGLIELSAVILTQIYLGLYGNDRRGLFLVTAVLPAITSVVFMFTVRTMEAERQPNDLRVFLKFFYLTIVLALFLMVVSLLENYNVLTRTNQMISTVVVFILLFIPLSLVIQEENNLSTLKKQPLNPPTEVPIEKPQALPADPNSSTRLEEKTNRYCFASIFNKPERGEDHSILQAILSIDMLYIFIIILCGYGSGLTAHEYFGPVGEALAKKERLVSAINKLVSIWDYYGRVYSGFLSELLLIKWKVPRAMLLAVMLLLQSIGLLLVAFPEIPGAYYVATVTIAFSLGAQAPVTLAMISEFFGLKYYATLLNCAQLIVPLAVYLMNANLTCVLYANEAIKDLIAKGKDPSSVKDPVCEGSHCFRLSFSILAFIAFVGALVSLKFARRTREFYKGDIYKKYRGQRHKGGDRFTRLKRETEMNFGEGVKAPESEMAQPSVNMDGSEPPKGTQIGGIKKEETVAVLRMSSNKGEDN